MPSETSKASNVKSRLRSAFGFLPGADTVIRSVKKATSRVPFMDDVLAMYYCAIDPATPGKIRVVIGATLLYLVMPLDFIPDFLVFVGYGDDVTALMVLVKMVSSHVNDGHRKRAKAKLAELGGSDVPAGRLT